MMRFRAKIASKDCAHCTADMLCEKTSSHKNPPSHLLSLQKHITVEETMSQWLYDSSLAKNRPFA